MKDSEQPTLRWVSWAAVSSLPQAKKISLEDQQTTNRQHAARHGGVIVADLVIPGESRNIVLFEDACRRIDAYAQLAEMIAAKSFDVLVYLDRSRLGRKASLSMAVVELCHEAGIICYETENPPVSLSAVAPTHDDMLLGAIKSVSAQREIAKIQERHEMGMLGRVRRGNLPSGVSFGYLLRYDPTGHRIIEIDPIAAPIVRQMFAWYLAGAGTPMIAERLNEMNATTPTGKRWQSINVRSTIFRVWRYAGYSEVNRRSKKRPYLRAPGAWPPIVDESTALAVEQERTARIANRHIPDTPYLLSGVVWCRVCNRPLRIHTQTRQRTSRKRQIQLQCPGEHPRRFLSYQRTMTALSAAIQYVSGLASVDELLHDDATAAAQIAEQIAAHNTTIERHQSALHRADDAYTAGVLDIDRYRRQVERIGGQIEAERSAIAQLQQRAASAQSQAHRRTRLEELRDSGTMMLQSEDATAANAWLRTHVRIWAQDNQVVEVEFI